MDLARMLPTIIIGPLVQFLGFITNCLGNAIVILLA